MNSEKLQLRSDYQKMLDESASEQIKANNLGFFIFGGNTFVLGNDANTTTVNAGDLLIQLNGTQNLVAANFA